MTRAGVAAYATDMTEHPPKTREELSREKVEEARLELEKQAMFRRIAEETTPSIPTEEPVAEEDRVPTHDNNAGTSPDEVIDEHKLGRK